jgi:predicted nuclease of predicted toxin-antitoxin system
MNILIDMNLSPQLCGVLKTRGFQCVHWSEVGNPKADDTILMQWALRNEYVVLTHDLDFGAILAATKADAPSVVQIRTQDVLSSDMKTRLLEILLKYEAELSAGALIIVDENKSRVRILPLSRGGRL